MSTIVHNADVAETGFGLPVAVRAALMITTIITITTTAMRGGIG